MEKYELFDNKNESRYEYHIGEYTPHIEYKITKDGVVYLTHTRVPMALEGQGIGTALVKDSLEDIERKGLKVMPLCGFVATYIKRHPEWKKMLMEGVYV